MSTGRKDSANFTAISVRILAGVLLISSVLTLGTTAFLVLQEYRSDIDEFDRIFIQIENSYVDPISSAVWNVDHEQVERSLRGILALPDVTYVRITEGDSIYEFGEQTSESPEIREFPLEFKDQDRVEDAGKLEVQASMTRIYSRLKNRILVILVSQGLKTFLASSMILLFINFIITRRLVFLSNFFRRYDPRFPSKAKFESPPKFGRRKDDLDLMGSTIREMVDNLDDLYLNLEAKLQERTEELQHSNKEIQSVLDNITQGVCAIGGDQTIQSKYSQAMHSIYETPKISGQNAVDFLFRNSDVSDDKMGQIKMAIAVSIGSDSLSFSINRDSFPRQVRRTFSDGRVKILELDWSYIVGESNTIESILATIRDATKLREAEKEAKRVDSEMRLLANMISIGTDAFSRFCHGSYVQVLHCIAELREIDDLNSARDAILVELHTMKGNARTLGFESFSNNIHSVEEIFLQMENADADRDNLRMLNRSLLSLHGVILEYENLFKKRLAPLVSQNSLQSSFPEKLKDFNMADAKEFDLAKSELARHYMLTTSRPLSEAIQPITLGAEHLAQELGKKPVSIVLHDDKEQIRIRDSFVDVIVNILNHCFLNSLDHGIEPPYQRIESAKPAHGTITLDFRQANSNYAILEYYDDGKGLDLDSLRAVAEDRGYDCRSKSDTEVAALVFEPGVSTNPAVTEISGRGIGLDAVSRFLRDHDCRAEVKLTGGKEGDRFRPFKLSISLPLSKVFLKSQWSNPRSERKKPSAEMSPSL